MSWQEIVRQLYALDKTINETDLMEETIAAQEYAHEFVRLNTRLHKILGKNYRELPKSLIATCLLA